MRPEKKIISAEYTLRLKNSPFFVVVDYRGMSVAQFSELRKRLRPSGAELHVVKNNIFRIAAKEAGLADLTGVLAGQLAVVTGNKDIAAAALVLKKYQGETEKAKLQFGYLGNQRLSPDEVKAIADLPPISVLQGKLLGLLQTPAQQIVSIVNAPGSQVARVIKAYSEKAA